MPAEHSTGCPAMEQIERLVAGESGDEAFRLHVERCRICREAAERIRQNNELLNEFARGKDGVSFAPHTFAAGQEIPGYEIISEIRRGGQGVVFKAMQKVTRREVALKMLLHEAFKTPRQRRRFEREIELAAGLRHPHIVTVYDSGTTTDGLRYFAMEYVDGEPLSEMIARQHSSAQGARQVAPADSALWLFLKICDAVSYAHQH